LWLHDWLIEEQGMTENSALVIELVIYMAVGGILYALNPVFNKMFANSPSVQTVEPDSVTLMRFDGELGKFLTFATGVFLTTKFLSSRYGGSRKKTTLK
jgi:hypothetical protein